MKVLILSILVAVCYAQTPARPVIPETFESEVDAMFHEHETYEGHGMIARDEAKNEGVESIYSREEGRNESRIRLERFDMGVEFFIRGSGDQEHCEVRKTNSTTLPPYWGWLEYAKYVGQRKVRELVMDVWEFRGPGVLIEVLVDQENPNIPRYLNAELGSDRRELIFLKFDAVAPPASAFTIPSVCQQ